MMIDWDALLPAAPPATQATGAPRPEQVPAPPTADASSGGITPPWRDGDNRRRCTDCGNLNERGLCLAAHRGEIVASRSYTPIRELLRRCEGFRPLPDDPDQRTAWDRWGTIYGNPATPAAASPAPTFEGERGKDATL
ncbi:hypothetical protein [Sulfuritalea sp.]|uniref:hypothetical protein n=1 Tax=Sulfuritalea sp. TaxID=2480090 RepID=UPI00286DC2A9|nr:hypothetical protein [Sulfuritalea sp.]